jgi:hypothetical protein
VGQTKANLDRLPAEQQENCHGDQSGCDEECANQPVLIILQRLTPRLLDRVDFSRSDIINIQDIVCGIHQTLFFEHCCCTRRQISAKIPVGGKELASGRI